MSNLADGIAAGEDVNELLGEFLNIATDMWALYSADEIDYEELKRDIEDLIGSCDNSIPKIVATTNMNKYMDWLWHPSNQIPGNENALRVYESHLATVYQLGYLHEEAYAHIANVNDVPLTRSRSHTEITSCGGWRSE
ncbi:hypothetical protein MMC26_001916 [Xylographa opegraphella]|nr:hypothetical protein [Xylographa opegraphella]